MVGDMDPVRYGAFNVSDIYYCFSGAGDYGAAAGRATNAVLKDYLEQKQASYRRYNQSACATWSLSGPQSVSPTPTVRDYAEFESAVANGTAQAGDARDPIFTLIVMLPCEFLWAWLAAQLAPPASGNIYARWITANDSATGAYAMGNFLQDYIAETPIDEALATTLYLTAMEHEYRNFQAATP